MKDSGCNTTRDRWRYEDSRLFCNDQYVAVLEAKDGDESTCEYIAKTLDDYGRAIADYEEHIATLRRELSVATLAHLDCGDEYAAIYNLADGWSSQAAKAEAEANRLVGILDRHGICADCGRTMERCEADPNGRCL